MREVDLSYIEMEVKIPRQLHALGLGFWRIGGSVSGEGVTWNGALRLEGERVGRE